MGLVLALEEIVKSREVHISQQDYGGAIERHIA